MTGTVILIVTLITFILGIAGAVYSHYKVVLPDGIRIRTKYGGSTLYTVVSPNCTVSPVRHAVLHVRCTRALECLAQAIRETPKAVLATCPKGTSLDNLKTYIVYIVPQAEMVSGAAAFTHQFGGTPAAVVCDKYVEEIIETGQPVIHEACHAFLNDYIGDANDHALVGVWKDKDALNFRAEVKYHQLTK